MGTNTGVEPAAVMIEAVHASVTSTTVLGRITDVRTANIALVLVF